MPVPSLFRRGRRLAPWRPLAAVLMAAASLAAVASTATWSAPAPASPHAFGAPVFSANARGDIATIGNVTTTCDPTYTNENWSPAESAAACNGARTGAVGLEEFNGTPLPPVNNRLSMEDVDVDTDASTFNSSSARLELPAGSSVLWAGLHWNGATDVPSAPELAGSTYQVEPRRHADRFRIRFDTPAPGPAVSLDAAPAPGTARDTWDDTNPGGTVSYGAFVDVTPQVKAGGSGSYTIANLQSCRGFGGCFGSWSLTVAYANAELPARNLNVWHGWQLTTPARSGGVQAFTVNGLEPPPRGPVSARIGVVQADGDRGLGPDSLDISSPSSPTWRTFAVPDRPLAAQESDWFNSTVNSFGQRRPNSDASPNHLANLSQDIALVESHDVIGNDDESFGFRVKTASTESLYSQVVHSAVDLYEPEIAIAKTVEPPGPVPSGTTVTWTLDITNAGSDPIRRAVVTDPLPEGVRLVPGSVRYSAGGPASLIGPKTDAPGDDQVDWNPETRALTLRIGAGADARTGGTMGLAPAPDGSHEMTVSFQTVVDATPGTTIRNQAVAHGEGRELDDPFGPLVTEATGEASLALTPESDLGITKTDGDAVVHAVGDRFTYGLTAVNGGPSPATGVQMIDELDPMVRFVDSSDGCTAEGQTVTCPVGNLDPGAEATRTFVVEVVELPGPGHTIDNLAAVEGEQPNPDCTDQTPDALCNVDDEQTPQAQEPPATSTVPAPTTTAATTAAPPPTAAPSPPPPAPSSRRRAPLPRTGAAIGGLVTLGLVATGVGATVLVGRRRAAR